MPGSACPGQSDQSQQKTLYLSADAGDAAAMQQALKHIQESQIHGIVHSILHLEDQSLANMTSEQFLRSYTAKQQTGDVLPGFLKISL